MSIPERCKQVAEAHKQDALDSLAELEKVQGSPFTDQEKENLWEKGLWRLALIRAGEMPPVPESVTVDLINSTPPSDLLQLLWDYICAVKERTGCYESDTTSQQIIRTLPRGLRMVYTVMLLDGEVQNGGFYQFFTNLSRLVEREAIEDLCLIGAEQHIAIVVKACTVNEQIKAKYPRYAREAEPDFEPTDQDDDQTDDYWQEYESGFEPQFDRLSSEWYALEKLEPLYELMERFVRNHPQECVHALA